MLRSFSIFLLLPVLRYRSWQQRWRLRGVEFSPWQIATFLYLLTFFHNNETKLTRGDGRHCRNVVIQRGSPYLQRIPRSSRHKPVLSSKMAPVQIGSEGQLVPLGGPVVSGPQPATGAPATQGVRLSLLIEFLLQRTYHEITLLAELWVTGLLAARLTG